MLFRKLRRFCYIIYYDKKKLKIDDIDNSHCCIDTLYLKKEIEKKLGIEVKYQELSFNGKILKDSETLDSNGIINGKEINLKIKIVGDFKNLINNKEK